MLGPWGAIGGALVGAGLGAAGPAIGDEITDIAKNSDIYKGGRTVVEQVGKGLNALDNLFGTGGLKEGTEYESRPGALDELDRQRQAGASARAGERARGKYRDSWMEGLAEEQKGTERQGRSWLNMMVQKENIGERVHRHLAMLGREYYDRIIDTQTALENELGEKPEPLTADEIFSLQSSRDVANRWNAMWIGINGTSYEPPEDLWAGAHPPESIISAWNERYSGIEQGFTDLSESALTAGEDIGSNLLDGTNAGWGKGAQLLYGIFPVGDKVDASAGAVNGSNDCPLPGQSRC